jgi:hypothetical protein
MFLNGMCSRMGKWFQEIVALFIVGGGEMEVDL